MPENPSDYVVTGSLAAVNDLLSVPVQPGDASIGVDLGSGFVATVTFEVSHDGGTLWRALILAGAGGSASTTTTGSNANSYQGTIPPGTTHFRVRVTAFTSGPVPVRIATSRRPSPSVVALGVAPGLAASNARVGMVAADLRWIADTPTGYATLAAGLTLTTTSRDMYGAGSAAVPSAAAMMVGYRGLSVADQPHTLSYEVADDNATFDRLLEVAAVLLAGKYVARFSDVVYSRYVRLAITNNGASAFTFARIRHIELSA